jgi:polyisoprenoid-binding protein YceI
MSNSATNPTQPTAPLADLSAGTWVLDPTASTISIRHKTMWGLVTVKGSFTKFSGEGEIGTDGSAHGTVTIDADSIDTKQAKRDTHLRSADFFDVAQHPTMTFAATTVTPKGPGSAEVTGDLTVLGRSRPLTFTTEAVATGPTAVTLTAKIDVDRDEFAMSWNRGGMMKGLTTVTLSLHFTHR